jgi:thiamine kinase-like enzyme
MNDNGRLAEVLQQYLGTRLVAQSQRISSCRIRRIYYKPGGKCRLSIKAKICDRDGNALGEQLYFGHIFASGQGEAAFEQARRQELLPPEFGDPIGFIPEWETVLWAYPNDPNVSGIATLMNPEKVFKLIAKQPKRFGIQNGYHPKAIAARLAKYVPGKRCAYFFDLTLEEKSSHAMKPHTIFAKTYTTEEGAEAFVIMNQIWRTEACQSRAFRMPQPYWYDDELNILWQEALNGQALAKIVDEVNLPETAKQAGAELAAFHGCGASLPEKMTGAFQLEELQDALAAVGQSLPQHAEAYARVHHKLMAAYEALPPAALTPVHGSFKFSHIFHTGREIAFIDFDGANQGDPCHDLGRFLAALHRIQFESAIDTPTARRAAENFCAAYHRAAKLAVPQARIDWFTAAHLLGSEIYKSVKSLIPGEVEQLLKIAEAII